jgi:hypothetical protein
LHFKKLSSLIFEVDWVKFLIESMWERERAGKAGDAIVNYVIMAGDFGWILFYTILQAASKMEFLNDFNKFSLKKLWNSIV